MRYIIDITQLIHWPGNLTGIPRVMDELAANFLNDTSKETIFVSWVKEAGAMCEVDFAATRPRRGEHIAYRPLHSTTKTEEVSEKSRQPASLLVKKAIKKVAIKSRFDRTPLYKKAVQNKKAIESSFYKKYIAQKGDKMFIPWGEWWDADWLNITSGFAAEGVELFPISHDILPMVVPQFSGNSASLENFIKQVFPVSKAVLTVSESSKNDLIKWMESQKLKVPPVKVFRLGEDFSFTPTKLNDTELEKRYKIRKEDYIVYVSTLEPRKNHLLLYYTYKLAVSKGIKLPHLIMIGRIGHDMDAIINMIKNDPEVNTSISIENNVNDEDLNWLYQNCKFTVTSSFYEGWGMSVLEAITRGKPVVCSGTSSLLEMPNDCVVHFNPASTDECLSAIQTMMQPMTLKKYKASAKKYVMHSWDASYRQVIEILDGDQK